MLHRERQTTETNIQDKISRYVSSTPKFCFKKFHSIEKKTLRSRIQQMNFTLNRIEIKYSIHSFPAIIHFVHFMRNVHWHRLEEEKTMEKQNHCRAETKNEIANIFIVSLFFHSPFWMCHFVVTICVESQQREPRYVQPSDIECDRNLFAKSAKTHQPSHIFDDIILTII